MSIIVIEVYISHIRVTLFLFFSGVAVQHKGNLLLTLIFA